MSKGRVTTKPEDFPIQPDHIDGSRHLWNAFDHTETEVSAGWIIRFLQERGKSWAPFTYGEINAFYSREHKDGFTFNRLINVEMVPPNLARAFAGHHDDPVPRGGGWILEDADGYHVTDDFITRCFQSSPAEESP
ncbi:MAG: hypothetical protein WD200_00175 [Candidatus Andersenbacteria bacterium]